MPQTPPGEMIESDNEEWNLPNGQDAPMTPMEEDIYSPASPEPEPMSMGHLQPLGVRQDDRDIQPATDLVGAGQEMVESISGDNLGIFEVRAQLGAKPKQYRGERSKAVGAFASDIYSPPRVTAAAKLLPGLGILPGCAFDLTTVDKDGRQLDFTKESMRQAARQEVSGSRPCFLIDSPMCTDYCSWQDLNAQRN